MANQVCKLHMGPPLLEIIIMNRTLECECVSLQPSERARDTHPPFLVGLLLLYPWCKRRQFWYSGQFDCGISIEGSKLVYIDSHGMNKPQTYGGLCFMMPLYLGNSGKKLSSNNPIIVIFFCFETEGRHANTKAHEAVVQVSIM